MSNGDEVKVMESEIVPVSSGQEGGQITHLGADRLALAEEAAKNAPRMEAAFLTVIVACTHASDWTGFGDRAELDSAGAERMLKHFGIKIANMTRQRKDWVDENGKPAYSWTYEATASMGNTEVQISATYGTRDKFTGFVDREWRPLIEINEGDMMSAARHKCIGQAIRTLLGLRSMPRKKIEDLMGKIKSREDGGGSMKQTDFGKGSQGGAEDATEQDTKHQGELRQICVDLAYGDQQEAVNVLEKMSAFQGRDGEVKGKRNVKYLAGTRLNILMKKAREIHADWLKSEKDDAGAKG